MMPMFFCFITFSSFRFCLSFVVFAFDLAWVAVWVYSLELRILVPMVFVVVVVVELVIYKYYGLSRFFVYWAIQRNWLVRVNALCNLSRKMSREVAAHFRADF